LAEHAQTDADGALSAAVAAVTDYNAKAANSLRAKFIEEGLPLRLPVPSADQPNSPPDCG
jgi:hypothetical protein